jgi:hypothetical protein
MDTSSVIAQIDLEISRLQRARELLTGAPKKGPGRPKSAVSTIEVKGKGKPGRRQFSAEALEKMAAAQRKRWAKVRKAKKAAAAAE